MTRYFCILIASGMLCFLFLDNAEARQLIKSRGFSLDVNDSYQCGEEAEFTIHAPDRRFFKGDPRQIRGFVLNGHALLGGDCGEKIKKLSRMKIIGKTDNIRVYEGHIDVTPKQWLYAQDYIYDQSAAGQKPRPAVKKRTTLGLPRAEESTEFLNVTQKHGQFYVNLVKDPATSKGGEFGLSVGLHKKLLVSFPHSTYAACAEIMPVDIMAWPNAFKYAKFRDTGKGSDLPPAVIDALYMMRDALMEQCGQLEAMRFKFYSMNHERDLNYNGTIVSDNDWAIQDGVAPTKYDSARIVKFKMRNPNNPAGIDFRGTCESTPVLPLKPVYYNNSDRALSKPPTMTDYRSVAAVVAKRYAAECPGTEAISFSLNPIPEAYVCAQGALCYLTWSPQKPSQIMAGDFKPKPRLDDYNDVIKAFAVGDFKLLGEYKEFVRIFHNDFVERYSSLCRAHIESTVPFDVKTIETRYTSEGFVESKGQVGPTVRVNIDSKYAKRYKDFYGLNQTWGALFLMKRVHAYGSASRGIGFFINNINQIDAFISNRCMAEDVQTVYENLDRYYRHEQPLRVERR